MTILNPTSSDYKLAATKIGDILKWDVSVKEINRIASAVFKFTRQDFPHDSITSERAKLIYDWILSLARERMSNEERNHLLYKFSNQLVSQLSNKDKLTEEINKILEENNISIPNNKQERQIFINRNFHSEIRQHSESLFIQGNYFHAVFEACKVYNKLVKEKAESDKDGHTLMMNVWGFEKGTLKITNCVTETDKNIQEGVKHLSGGLMSAIRNPTSHEPALDWPINKEDCLDMLSFISFLLRLLDKAVYYQP